MDKRKMEPTNMRYPLTESQMGIYLECIKDPEILEYNIPFYLFFEKETGIDTEKLKDALRRTIGFYPVLKTCFRTENGMPGMFYNPDISYEIEEIESEDKDIADVYRSFMRPFDLENGPLFRFALVSMPKGIYLLEMIHHLIGDGSSCIAFNTNLGRAYQGLDLIPEEKNAFDLCLEEQGLKEADSYNESKAFYDQMLSGAEADSNILPDEIEDSPKRACGHSQVYYLKDYLDTEKLNERIKEFSLSGSTLFMGAFAYALGKMTNQTKAQFCMIEGGRHTEEVKDTFAMMVKTLPLCIDYSEESSIKEYLETVQKVLKGAIRHDSCSVVSLAETYEVNSDILFVYQGSLFKEVPFDGKNVPIRKVRDEKDAETKLSLDVFRIENDFELAFEYRADLYKDETIQSFAELCINIIKGMIGCDYLKEISFTDENVIQFYEAANNNDLEYDRSLTIVDLFRAQANRVPDNPAILFGERTISYRELDDITERLAQHLTKKGVKPEEPVGIMVKRSERFPICALAILKAGAACQPLDFNYPKERLLFMLEDSGAKMVLADEDLAEIIADFNGEVIYAEGIEALPAETDVALTPPKADSLFTIIYTSGTTGKPKGCMLEHRNLVNFSLAFADRFGVTEEDRAACYGAFGFDASMQDLYPYLTCGASVAIIPEGLRLDLPGLNEFIRKHKITMMDCTTQLGRQLVTNYPDNPYMRVFTVGGEKLVPCDPPNYRFVNTYGPTECTIYVTDHDVDRLYESVPIGRTFGNCDGYIVDKQMRLLPPGAVGELAISGIPVIRGYLNRPEKNAESFVPNTIFDKKEYERIYLTGDVCRYLTDGNIQFVGRKDDQVKIRGFRIELTEIERRIREYPEIRDAAVVARDLPGGGKAVAAYIVSDTEIGIPSLHHFIGETLPKYMIPMSTTQIEKIPLTPNGKVDKRKLPEPVFRKKESAPHVMNDLERDLVSMVAEITGIEEFDLTDSLVASGLTSLTTIVFSGKLHEKFGLKMSVPELMEDDCSLLAVENRILKDLLTGGLKVKEQEKDAEESEVPAEIPLCAEQLGVYYDSMKRPAALVYNIPMLYSFPEKTDTERLKDALLKTVSSHPVLSSKISLSGKDLAMQQIPEFSFDVTVTEIKEKDLKAYSAQFVRPFDLSSGPLVRAEIVKTEERIVLLFDVHHIVFDGLSLAVFLRELVNSYESGEAPVREAAYYRFIKEQAEFAESEKKEQAVRYYEDLFENFEEATDIAPDRAGKEEEALLKEARKAVSKEETDRFCKEHAVTPASLFLSALFYTAARCNAAEDVYLSMIASGREDAEYANTVGMLVKTFPLHGSVKSDLSAAEYMRDTASLMNKAIKNSIYPAMNLYDIYDFRPRINYACQIGVDEIIIVEGEEVLEEQIVPSLPKFHLSVHIEEEGEQYIVNVQYNDALYSDSYMQTFSGAIASCAENMMKNPDEKIAKISLLDPGEEKRVKGFSVTAEEEISCHLFHELFEMQADRYPDRTALIASDRTFSYKQLDQAMNRMANALRRAGLQNGDCAAILLPRTSALMISMYAVMKAGAAYIPCDPEYPEERIRYIIENSGAKYIITDSPHGFKNELYADELLKEADDSRPNLPVSPDDTAYMIYTSGSTGKPKGVVIRHEGIANYLIPHPENRHVFTCKEEGSVMVSVTTASFDMSLKETAVALCNGLTLVLADSEQTQNPLLLTELFERTGGDIFNATPSRMEQYMMLPAFCKVLAGCKVVMCGGEKYSPKLLERLKNVTDARIFNTYGPTEITVSCNAKDLTREEKICVGKPLLNVREYIVDSSDNILPAGFTGELYVGGKGVAKGYLNNKEMTEKSFREFNGEWIYKTGDYAKWTPEGDVVILGRTDHQVKLRGLRIELGEVERVILSCPGVIQCVVMIRQIRGTEHLCAYYVDEGGVTVPDLKGFISKSLTKYMVPTAFLRMEKMPQTPNGKTDVKALPEPELFQSDEYIEPETPNEKLIQSIFEEILNMERVSVEDSFFDLGGTSLSATSLLVKLNENGFEISYGDIFAKKTVRALASMTGAGGDFEDNLAGYDYSVFEDIFRENRMENLKEKGTPLGNVLVTGSAGFLGIHIVHQLLERTEGDVYCLLRDGRLPAEKRLESQLFYYFENDYSDLLGKRLFLVKGDVTETSWFDSLKDKEIHTVINCAALVKHFSQTDDIERTNAGGVLNLIEFCRQRESKLIQISTGSVAGDRVDQYPPKDVRLNEQSLYFGQMIDNQYVHSKFIAERYILEAMREGLKAKIMRVGNLAPRRSDGEFQINSSTNGFMGRLKAYLAIGAFPYSSMDYAVELAPIDETADAILRLSETPDSLCIFHPFNNHYVPLGDIILQMKKMGFSIDLVEDEEFLKRIRRAGEDPALAQFLTTLIAYENKDSSRVVEMIGVDNEYTTQVLYRLGFSWPMTARNYMEQFLNALYGLGFFALKDPMENE